MSGRAIASTAMQVAFSFLTLIVVGSGMAGSFAAHDAAVAAIPRSLPEHERVVAQRAIEEVYWRHRIWPSENRTAKPTLEEVMSEEDLRKKVEDSLRKSNALDRWWKRPINAGQLQAEIDRMVRTTRRPEVLRELFAALGNDPFLIAESLARPLLADRLIRSWYETDSRLHAVDADGSPIAHDATFDRWWAANRHAEKSTLEPPPRAYHVPLLTGGSCTDDTWTAIPSAAPDPRYEHVAVWTGSEMIVWGGRNGTALLDSGGRYDPATDTWSATSLSVSTPSARHLATAVWTGSTMIVWGGQGSTALNTGGRYNPSTDTWTVTGTGVNVPSPRYSHVGIWTGSEMIVWGGFDGTNANTGGRYRPSTDAWVPTGTANVPAGRLGATAVWTGSVMIVWGGQASGRTNTGGLYDPVDDSWESTPSGGMTPSARMLHTAVWTGSAMIVWGGDTSTGSTNTGGRYVPGSNTWQPTSTGAGVPSARTGHAAVWTGAEMIVWGGTSSVLDMTGGRYNPLTNTWAATGIGANAPEGRRSPTAVWTGAEMIVWGGLTGSVPLDTGGRYSPASDSWVPTQISSSTPASRAAHAAVWTGAEMIVWGGKQAVEPSSGGRYDPATSTWTATRLDGTTPPGGSAPAALWTGTQMIVWGGFGGAGYFNTGGRYSPLTDTWTPTSTGANVPSARMGPSAVWIGSEMIVWGGYNGTYLNSGSRYDPALDLWMPMNVATAPPARANHTTVWTGSEMIVWGGTNATTPYQNSGGRYDPVSDSWTGTSAATGVPAGRVFHSAVWTGSRMVVWGGNSSGSPNVTSTGGRYDPIADSWQATSTGSSVPSPRFRHTAIWTGHRMIVWGGSPQSQVYFHDGGRYDPDNDAWEPTSTGPGVPSARWFHTAVSTGTEMIVWGGEPLTRTGGRYCHDACYGPAPTGVPSVQVTQPAHQIARLTWTPVDGASAYDVVRGSLLDLHASHGDFTFSTNHCVADDLASTTLDDGTFTPCCVGYFYIVRAVNCAGFGSYDGGDPAQVGSRDAEVASSIDPCP